MVDALIWYFEVFILTYFVAINGIYTLFTIGAFFDLVRYRHRIGHGESTRNLLSETTYEPISILVPAHDEAATIVASVRCLLQLGYPSFEVIVVNDGSTDNTLDLLVKEFDLSAVASATWTRISTREVKQAYRSLKYPELLVLDKVQGGKSDALNAAINVSKYPLFCSIDADSLLEPQALRRIARAFAEDDRIIAAGGVVRVLNGALVERGGVVASRVPWRPLLLCQSLEYVRGFSAGRTSLARINSLLIIAGAFGLFRKAPVIEIGGYHRDTVCEDMELVVRLRRKAREAKRVARVIFVPDPVCWTQVPSDWGSLIQQRDRWQRGLLESLWMHRKMFMNPRYGAVGLIAMPFYTLFEALGPVIELSGYVFVAVLFFLGLLNKQFFILFLLLAGLYSIILSLTALNIDDLLFNRYRRTSDLARMMLGSVLEFFGYRQFLTLVRAFAFCTVVARRNSWGHLRRDKFSEQPVKDMG